MEGIDFSQVNLGQKLRLVLRKGGFALAQKRQTLNLVVQIIKVFFARLEFHERISSLSENTKLFAQRESRIWGLQAYNQDQHHHKIFLRDWFKVEPKFKYL